MMKDEREALRPEAPQPPADVRAWLATLPEAERAALEKTWHLAGLARPNAAPDAVAASDRFWTTLDARARHPAPDRQALRGSGMRLGRRPAAVVLAGLALVGLGVMLGWAMAGRASAPGVPAPSDDLSEFMVLLRGGDFDGRSPEEQQRIVAAFVAWAGTLQEAQRFRGGDELAHDGRVLLRDTGQVVERPWTLSPDEVGGYFIITARDYDEAVAIAKDCPQLDYGGIVEVRRIVQQ